METDRYRHGTIAWTELAVADVARARGFYAELLGWSYAERDGGWLASVAGGHAAAILGRGAGEPPSAWLACIAVDDPAATAQAALAAGAAQAPAPSLLPGARRLRDPAGAPFAIWDGRPLDGARHRLNAPGGLAWNELWTPEVAPALAFYRAAIGWGHTQHPGTAGVPYDMFAGRDDPAWTHGGARPLAAGPAHWMSYFEVEDCRASIQVAHRLGATVTLPAMHIPGVGWLATFRDLDGAGTGLMQSTPRG